MHKIIRQEKPVYFSVRNKDLFGVLYIPNVSPLPKKTVLIQVCRDLRNRVGLKLARELSSLGFYVFRFDFFGRGDSSGIPRICHIEQPFTHELIDVVNFVNVLLQPKRTIVLGNCFDAITSLSIVPFCKIHGLILMTFPIVNSNELIKQKAKQISFGLIIDNFRKYRIKKELFDVNLLRKSLNLGFGILKKKLINAESDLNIMSDIPNQFSIIIKDRLPTLLLFGSKDFYYPILRQYLEQINYTKYKNINLCVMEGGELYGLNNIQSQDFVFSMIVDWMTSTYIGTDN